MTIGDILAAIAVVLACGATWAATVLLLTLAFPSRSARAQAALTLAPGRCLTRGLALLVAVGVVAVILGKSHAGPVRILAGALWAGLGALAAIGSGGVVRLMGARIESVGSGLTPFAALTRGTVLYVAAGFLPIVGWFFVTPVAALLTLGAGWTALRGGQAAPSTASSQVTSPTFPRSALADPERAGEGAVLS